MACKSADLIADLRILTDFADLTGLGINSMYNPRNPSKNPYFCDYFFPIFAALLKMVR